MKNSVRADRLGDDERRVRAGHHSAVSRHARLRVSADRLERAVRGRASGTTRCGTPSSAATAAQSRLCRSSSWTTPRAGRAADARSSASVVEDGVDEPDTSLARKRVRRPCRGLVDDPREAGLTAVVAELDLHGSSVGGAPRVANGHSRRPRSPNLPQGHSRVPDVTISPSLKRVCVGFGSAV